MTEVVFAIPGDHRQKTGGYIYEATVLDTLPAIGCATRHLRLSGGFPTPDAQDMADALDHLCAVPSDQVILLDGFLVGTLEPDRLSAVRAPMVGLVHHPLGLETGLAAERAAFLRANERRVLARMHHILVPSPHTAAVLRRDFGVPGDKLTIARPGFARPAVRSAPAFPPLVLSVGLIAPRKGHDTLIRALGQIRDLAWRAEIVGKTFDTAHSATLRDLRDGLGFAGRVSFTGQLDDTELADRFASATVFALATKYEGYGMVLSEAMLHGLPVVSCAAGAVPDTVGDAGLLVPVDDHAAFAAALRRVLSQPAAAADLRDKALRKAADLPTWNDTARLIAQTLRKVRATASAP